MLSPRGGKLQSRLGGSATWWEVRGCLYWAKYSHTFITGACTSVIQVTSATRRRAAQQSAGSRDSGLVEDAGCHSNGHKEGTGVGRQGG